MPELLWLDALLYEEGLQLVNCDLCFLSGRQLLQYELVEVLQEHGVQGGLVAFLLLADLEELFLEALVELVSRRGFLSALKTGSGHGDYVSHLIWLASRIRINRSQY